MEKGGKRHFEGGVQTREETMDRVFQEMHFFLNILVPFFILCKNVMKSYHKKLGLIGAHLTPLLTG